MGAEGISLLFVIQAKERRRWEKEKATEEREREKERETETEREVVEMKKETTP